MVLYRRACRRADTTGNGNSAMILALIGFAIAVIIAILLDL